MQLLRAAPDVVERSQRMRGASVGLVAEAAAADPHDRAEAVRVRAEMDAIAAWGR